MQAGVEYDVRLVVGNVYAQFICGCDGRIAIVSNDYDFLKSDSNIERGQAEMSDHGPIGLPHVVTHRTRNGSRAVSLT